MIKILKGNFVFTKEMDRFEVYENGYVIVENGKIKLLTKELPEKYQNTAVEDMGNQFIMAGVVDLHVHAPKWLNTGIGYSKELLRWLNDYTFPL